MITEERSREAMLADFLLASSVAPFVWGESDCMMEVADWVRRRTGFDAGGLWRGRYADQDGCRALIRAAGGFVPAMRATASAAGLVETDGPQRGDIGVVLAEIVHLGRRRVRVPIGGVFLGRLWRIKVDVGHAALELPRVCAWRVP